MKTSGSVEEPAYKTLIRTPYVQIIKALYDPYRRVGLAYLENVCGITLVYLFGKCMGDNFGLLLDSLCVTLYSFEVVCFGFNLDCFGTAYSRNPARATSPACNEDGVLRSLRILETSADNPRVPFGRHQ
jgi:hypothetical protein